MKEQQMKPDDAKLKPCPFCGGKASAYYHADHGGMIGESWHVECGEDDCGCGTCHHESDTEAVTAWNRRADSEAVTTLQSELAEAWEASVELDRLLYRIRRTSEGSAGIMRDNRRTGRWEGAEKTARQFDRLAKYAREAAAIHAALGELK